MAKHHEKPDAQVDDRRRGNRKLASGAVRLTLQSQVLTGRADNVSPTGILLYSEGELRVQVETNDNGVTKTRSGRLVRAQRMGQQEIGWAIEFDPA